MNNTPFQKITEACKTTGLSQYFLRKGCKAGTIPHTKTAVHITSTCPPCCGNLARRVSGRRQNDEQDNIPDIIPGDEKAWYKRGRPWESNRTERAENMGEAERGQALYTCGVPDYPQCPFS